MKKILLGAVLAALMAIGASAGDASTMTKEAVSDHYVGLVINTSNSSARMDELDVDGDGLPEFTTTGFGIIGGKKVLERDHMKLYVEGRLLRGYTNENTAEDVTVTSLNLFLRPQFTLLQHVNVFGLVGTNTVKFEDTYRRLDVTSTGFAAGFGIQANIKENFAITYDAVWSNVEEKMDIFRNPEYTPAHSISFLYRF